MTDLPQRPWWRLTFFVFVMLLIEFLDEFAYGGLEAARPLIRDAFALSYVQVGLITTVPVVVATVVEPIFGLFADSSRRKPMMVFGAVCFGLGLIVQGVAAPFWLFLIGAALQAPASGVFVNLAQASLMDDAPDRRENRMAQWTFSGSLAVVIGPLALSAMIALGSSWRFYFIGAGVIALLVALLIVRLPESRALRSTEEKETNEDLRSSLRRVAQLLRRGDIWRWLALLEASDLMLDMLFGFLALYMVDVVGVSQAEAAMAIAVWTGVGLIGDFLLIPLLERVRGIVYLRFSALVVLFLYPTFLLIDGLIAKLIVLGLMGLFNAGWYSILKSKLYDALGDQSGAVLIVGNAAGLFGALLPVAIGFAAQRLGLDVAMWFLIAGPIALLLGLPRGLQPRVQK